MPSCPLILNVYFPRTRGIVAFTHPFHFNLPVGKFSSDTLPRHALCAAYVAEVVDADVSRTIFFVADVAGAKRTSPHPEMWYVCAMIHINTKNTYTRYVVATKLVIYALY